MNKDARYLIRLANAASYAPADHERLLQQVRERLRPLGAQAINLRVSRSAVEFDLFCKPERKAESFLPVLESIGAPVTVRRLDLPLGPVDLPAGRQGPQDVITEARNLFNAERYWEVHEVLEGLWKKTRGQEKQLLQGLILAAAALVHVQKDQGRVAWAMLEEAARRLQDQPPAYYGLDVQGFSQNLKKVIASRTINFLTV